MTSSAGVGPVLQQVRLLPPGGSYLSSRLLSGKQKYFIEYILYCILLFIYQWSSLGNILKSYPRYHFEPLRAPKISCEDRLNNTNIVPHLETVMGRIFNCQRRPQDDSVVASCLRYTHIVVKTIRLHLNGILPWIGKHPTLKVSPITLLFYMFLHSNINS